MSRRFDFEVAPSNLCRPHLMLADPCDGEIWVGLYFGLDGCDPAFRVDVLLSGLLSRPFIALANRRWDRAVARQKASRS
ncbi:MAG: hypothetical protein JWN67_5007 [Actinomycetia bacterium]|nr:hypothetical protein [Actinomycetes bacterium]